MLRLRDVSNLCQKLEALREQAKSGTLDVGDKEHKSTFLTYLLSQTELSPEEVNSNCVDMFLAASETVLLCQLFCSQVVFEILVLVTFSIKTGPFRC